MEELRKDHQRLLNVKNILSDVISKLPEFVEEFLLKTTLRNMLEFIHELNDKLIKNDVAWREKTCARLREIHTESEKRLDVDTDFNKKTKKSLQNMDFYVSDYEQKLKNIDEIIKKQFLEYEKKIAHVTGEIKDDDAVKFSLSDDFTLYIADDKDIISNGVKKFEKSLQDLTNNLKNSKIDDIFVLVEEKIEKIKSTFSNLEKIAGQFKVLLEEYNKEMKKSMPPPPTEKPPPTSPPASPPKKPIKHATISLVCDNV